jgi:hypothetical protein
MIHRTTDDRHLLSTGPDKLYAPYTVRSIFTGLVADKVRASVMDR